MLGCGEAPDGSAIATRQSSSAGSESYRQRPGVRNPQGHDRRPIVVGSMAIGLSSRLISSASSWESQVMQGCPSYECLIALVPECLRLPGRANFKRLTAGTWPGKSGRETSSSSVDLPSRPTFSCRHNYYSTHNFREPEYHRDRWSTASIHTSRHTLATR